MKLGEHVLAQYEALGEERQHRAHDLMCMNLADVLQPLALARYRDASFNSIQRVVAEDFARAGADTIWGKYQRLSKQVIASLGLNDFQAEKLNKLIDLMPDIFVEFIARMASRFEFLIRENAATLALVLRDMFQEEANHAESKRYN